MVTKYTISQQPLVQTSNRLLGSWDDAPDLEPQVLTIATAPEIDSLTLVYRYGFQKKLAQDDQVQLQRATQVGIGVNMFVRVEFTQYLLSTVDTLEWYGYLLREHDQPGYAQAAGDTTYVAVGLAWFLARQYVDRTRIRDGYVDRAIGYNTGNGSYDRDHRNPGNKVVLDNGAKVVGAGGSLWTAREIVEHLLEHNAPRNRVGAASPAAWKLHPTAASYLEWFTPTVRTEGRTVMQSLDEIISPRRGLYWWLSLDTNDDAIYLHVNSGLHTSLQFVPYAPGSNATTIPAATQRRQFDPDLYPYVVNVEIDRDTSQVFDAVRVRGALRTVTASVTHAGANSISQLANFGSISPMAFTRAWNDQQETQYATPGGSNAAENDKARRADELQAVYRDFVFVSDNPSANLAHAAATPQFLAPRYLPGASTPNESVPMDLAATRLLRSTPLLAVGAEHQQGMPPFAVVHVGDGAADPASQEWIKVDAISLSKPEFANYSLTFLDEKPGFSLRSAKGLQHTLAKGVFAGAASECQAEVDYRKVLVTCSFEMDDYCEAIHPPVTQGSTDRPREELVLYVGARARMDFVAYGTVVGVGLDGALQQETTPGGKLVRDDRELCQKIAAAAYKWYSQERRNLKIDCYVLGTLAELGSFVQRMYVGIGWIEPSCVVTRLTYDFQRHTTVLDTSIADLDPVLF